MTFSITIPAYKSQFLEKAIASVVAQTFKNWELIIVDDCSPEHLYQIVEPFQKDNRIHYYRNEKNCGAENVVDNWNICLSHATGDYIICMGDDDCLLPWCLEEYQKLLSKKHPLEILSVLHTLIHNSIQIKAYSSKYSQDEIAKMINIHPYRVKLEIQKLKNVPLKYLVQLKKNLTDSEYKFKTGQSTLGIEREVEYAILQ